MRTVLAAVSAMAVTTGQASVLRGWLAIRKTATRQGKVLHVESGLPMSERNIVGIGGGGSSEEETRRLVAHAVGLTGKKQPKVSVVPTAVADDADLVLSVFGLLPEGARPSFVAFFPWPPEDLRRLALDQDVIFVSGGDPAGGLGGWDRVDWLERRDDLLVRGRSHRLVRPSARGHARRPRLSRRQRVPALRR
ncbi:MAG: hypothetical protein E6G23_09245 [Actinobacteria bacterium]|nr:MAG: hypothetical protein E6G23_09245 [Actinomycetota bacterium]